MKCEIKEVVDKDGKVVMPCHIQERLIHQLRVENARLKKRCNILQRIVNGIGRPAHEKPARRETARDQAERLFQSQN